MKILIVSYHFYPKNTPRAFRTHELVKEFCKRGFDVTLILPKQVEYINEIDPQLKGIKNLEVVLLGEMTAFAKPSVSKLLNKENRFRKVAKDVYRYFNPYTETRPYIDLVYRYLRNSSTKYDKIISIAHPFSTLVGTAKAIRSNPILKSCPIKVAEYSDPFSLQKSVRMFFGYKIVDRWIAKTFDYISIPTEKAIESYKKIKEVDRIKVIPQGFNFDNVELSNYIKNSVPSFGYAGVFYENIRNPDVLFKFLLSINFDFKFHVFTSPTNKDTNDIIDKYKKRLNEKLIVSYDLPRLELIRELSSLDFLINIDNLSDNQVPSKLIDYSLTQRPIYSFSQDNFQTEIFLKFMNGDYKDSLRINIDEFDIKTVTDKFLSLV